MISQDNTESTPTLYVYTLSPERLELINGVQGVRRLADALGIDDEQPIEIGAWDLDSFPDRKFHTILTDDYGVSHDTFRPHEPTIAKTKGLVLFIRDEGRRVDALKSPNAASGLTYLFDVPLPAKPPKTRKSDARIGGMVATYALVAMLAFMGLLIWITS